ncbi:MAG TPA: Wadjet anti-phage system protein JetD domain-containing protein, partial [Rheinheimera sp.]|nr:Wadjet anti-phage system protein JetD domain-containing protein [Rheinheimera sp.]
MRYPPLNAQALRYLQQLQQRLKASGSERVKTSTKTVQQVLAWCIEYDLVPGNSLTLPQFSFSLALLNDIARVQRQLQQACFLDALSQNSRLDNAEYSQQELKSIGVKPRQHRVLLKLQTPVAVVSFAAEFIDIDWQQLPLAQFDALLVVENLDCFYQLHAFRLQLPYQQPLIIYRGDKLYSKGCKALKAAWLRQNKPAIYFGDFDAKGVSIALNEGYSAMLLPDFA